MRLLIYKLLAEKQVAVTLSYIENAFEKTDKATLYKTIIAFEEKDIVDQIDYGTELLNIFYAKKIVLMKLKSIYIFIVITVTKPFV